MEDALRDAEERDEAGETRKTTGDTGDTGLTGPAVLRLALKPKMGKIKQLKVFKKF